MIKTIIFDIGGVILNVDHMIMCRNYEKYSDFSAKKIKDAIFKSGLKQRFEHGDYTPKQVYEILKKELNLTINFNMFKDIWSDIFWLNDQIMPIIRKLKKTYKLALLSNTDMIHFNTIKRKFNFVKYFDVVVVSYTVKMMKPEQRIYEITLKKANTNANEALFIDDKEENVAGASKLGIKSIHFNNADRLVRKLRAIGIEI